MFDFLYEGHRQRGEADFHSAWPFGDRVESMEEAADPVMESLELPPKVKELIIQWAKVHNRHLLETDAD